MQSEKHSEILTLTSVAEAIGVSQGSLRSMLKSGAIGDSSSMEIRYGDLQEYERINCALINWSVVKFRRSPKEKLERLPDGYRQKIIDAMRANGAAVTLPEEQGAETTDLKLLDRLLETLAAGGQALRELRV